MSDWRNPVKAALEEGRAVVAATITAANPDVAAHTAALGFDFLWIEMEHSPITLETLRNMVLATRHIAPPFARVPVNEIWMAKRVLDAGACGVIFPFTSTPEMAAQAVAACRYPPHGRRGSGAGLASFAWPGAGSYYDSADCNVFVMTVVEDVPGLRNIEDIAATPGLDAIFIGTSDLSFSLGHRGAQDAAEVQDAIARIAEATRRHGKFLGRPAGNPEQIAQYREQGFSIFQGPTDIGFLAAGARQYLAPLGKARAESKIRALY